MSSEKVTGYALVEFAGKQFQAVAGRTLAVDRLSGEPGDSISLDKVLLVKSEDGSCKVGQPYVSGATVKASIVKHMRGPKLVVFKFQRRKRVRVKNGHRQPMTVLKFDSVAK